MLFVYKFYVLLNGHCHTRVAAFGASTQQELLKHNLILDIPAPTPASPSMTMAVEQYIKLVNK